MLIGVGLLPGIGRSHDGTAAGPGGTYLFIAPLPPGLGSWLRLLLSQQVSRWKEKGRHSMRAERWSFCRASPCPPLTALRAGFPPGHAPRCQEGVPAGAGSQDPGWNSVVIHHPQVPRPVRRGQCPSQSCDGTG